MQKPEKSALLGFQGAVKASKQKAWGSRSKINCVFVLRTHLYTLPKPWVFPWSTEFSLKFWVFSKRRIKMLNCNMKISGGIFYYLFEWYLLSLMGNQHLLSGQTFAWIGFLILPLVKNFNFGVKSKRCLREMSTVVKIGLRLLKSLQISVGQTLWKVGDQTTNDQVHLYPSLTNLYFFQYVNDDLPRGKMGTYVKPFICGIGLLFGSYIILSVIFRLFFCISKQMIAKILN